VEQHTNTSHFNYQQTDEIQQWNNAHGEELVHPEAVIPPGHH